MANFSFFNKNQLSSQVLKILSSDVILAKYPSLKDYLSAQAVSYKESDLADVCKWIERVLLEQLTVLSVTHFQLMKVSKDWGNAGESQIITSFGRMILGYSLETQWTYESQRNFEDRILQLTNQFELNDKNADQLLLLTSQYKFRFTSLEYEAHEFEKINQLLSFLGSTHIYFYGQASGKISFYYGLGEEKVIGDYLVIVLKKEIMRTPSVIMQLAAVTGKKTTLIRMEALESIIYQKWLPVAEQNYMYRSMVSSDIAWNISMAIKQHALNLYGINNESDLLKNKKTFILDMQDTVLHHELGHGVMQDIIIDIDFVALGKGSEIVKETIYASMLEFFADFAPQRGKVWGAMCNMCRISKKDTGRATRMFYMYLSDVWFFDTPDEYMYLYSELMFLILSRYIKPDHSIDFDTMESDIVIDLQRIDHSKFTILERLHELFVNDVVEIKSIIENATYNFSKTYSYREFKKIVLSIYQKYNDTLDEHDVGYKTSYWMNMVNYVLKISDSEQKMRSYLDESEAKTLKKVMVLSCGRKMAEAYNFDHRAYIFDKMIELGIVADKEAAKRFYKGPRKVRPALPQG